MPPLVMCPTKYLMWEKLPEFRSGKYFFGLFVSVCYRACPITDDHSSGDIGP